MRNALKVGLVLRVGLDAQRGSEDELADGGAEAREEGIEGLDVTRSARVFFCILARGNRGG